MGIFTRTRDIVNANINAALDKAEDPEKLLRHMILEMEETLIEIKAACAGVIAGRRKIERAEQLACDRAEHWASRAEVAIDRGREDLAREALHAKRRAIEEAEAATKDLDQFEELEAQYREDIVQLEQKLSGARDRQRILVQRHRHAVNKMRAEQDIRRLDSSEAFVRFEEFECRLERAEADIELVNFGRKHPGSLDEQFAAMERDEDIEKELRKLKESHKKSQAVSA